VERTDPGGPVTLEDADLVRQACDGSEPESIGAFEALVLRHQDHVLRVIGQAVRHRQDAEDLASETFVRAWKSLSELRQPELFRAWLNRIALNLARNHIRDEKVRGRVSLLEQEILEQRAIAPAMDPGADLRAALAELPESFHLLLKAKYEAGLTYGEIADQQSVSSETVKDRLRKARQALEAILAKKGLLEPGQGGSRNATRSLAPILPGPRPVPRPEVKPPAQNGGTILPLASDAPPLDANGEASSTGGHDDV
jgi:RNA polymerase sigma-70 factor (ECF subfamily)